MMVYEFLLGNHKTSVKYINVMLFQTLSGNKWRLRKRVFGVNLFNVVKITITWVATSSELGLKNIVINACATGELIEYYEASG